MLIGAVEDVQGRIKGIVCNRCVLNNNNYQFDANLCTNRSSLRSSRIEFFKYYY